VTPIIGSKSRRNCNTSRLFGIGERFFAEMNRGIKERARKWAIRLHKSALRFGVVILRNNYYTSVPDLNVLERTQHVWARKSELVGINLDLEGQIRELREICLPFEPEYRGNNAYKEACARSCGPGFGYVEAQALYSVVRYFRPRTVIEVGSGVSTFCLLNASEQNRCEGGPSRLICVEPYPRTWLKRAPVELISDPVQQLPLDFFSQLKSGDLLFIDSSHTVKTGSDVNFLMLEVLPRLADGVLIHFHDITLPYGYSPLALQVLVQPAETALLHALLIANENLRILFSLSLLHYDCPDILSEVFPEYVPRFQPNGLREHGLPFYGLSGHFPTSIYLRCGPS